MRPALRQLVVVAFTFMVAACSAAHSGRPPSDPDVIRRDQVLAGSYQNAYDVVRAIHPNWLVKRSPSNSRTQTPIWVYVDGTKYGDVTWLRNVPGNSIGTITRIDAGTATTKWGTGHSEGVLLVTTYIPN